MAITFESIKDPYGLGAAGNAIGQAAMQRSLMGLQDRKKQEEEERQRNLQIQNSQTLGTTLKEFLPAEGQQWDQDRIASFMAAALESGASVNDILNSIKGLQTGQSNKAAPQSTFARELAKKNVGQYQSYAEHGRKAKDLLSNWDELDTAINDPERFENPAMRALKAAPGASVAYSPSDQTISTYAKEIITNFTNMKNLRLTDAKLRWLESISPAPWKSKEANLQASAYFKRLAQIQEAYGDVATNIVDSYEKAGIEVPGNFDALVEKAIEPLREEIDNLYKSSTQSEQPQQKATELGSQFDKMPNPKDYEGAEITDSKGNKYVSNGTKWSKVK